MRKHKFHSAPISHIFKVKEGSLMGVSDQDLMEKITAGAAENCETFSLQIHSWFRYLRITLWAVIWWWSPVAITTSAKASSPHNLVGHKIIENIQHGSTWQNSCHRSLQTLPRWCSASAPPSKNLLRPKEDCSVPVKKLYLQLCKKLIY